MLKIITGLPGHNKTSNTLAEFLTLKGKRPLYATAINGFDFDKHGVGRLEHLNEIFDLPAGSLVLCDEAQKFLRPRGKTEALPAWVAEFETHRHKGIDLWYTTQHPMLIDIHVRRLTDEHWHYFRPKGIQRLTTRREWDGIKDDPTDYHAIQVAEIKSAVPPKWIFSEYKSTAEDTTKTRFPKKLIYAAGALVLAVAFVGFKAYSLFGGLGADEPVPPSLPAVVSPVAVAQSFSPENMGQPRRLTIADFQPVSELAPWTASAYAGAAKIVAAPRFAGCVASSKGCDCMTQQGTYLEVEADTCVKVVYGKAMPFNPFKPDSPDYQTQPSEPALAVAHHEENSLVVGSEDIKPLPQYQSIYAQNQGQ